LRWDKEFGVDTARPVLLSDLIVPSTSLYAVHYIPISSPRFRKAMSILPIQHSEFTFVDLGSGKGKAVLLAAEFQFKRCVGVEFAKELHEAALRNFALYTGPRACTKIDSVCVDVLNYALPLEPLVLFLFNPFEAPVMERVLTNLRHSVEESPRPIWVVYYFPLERHVFERATFLSVHHDEGGFVMYRSAV
jgi:hypothetical protein